MRFCTLTGRRVSDAAASFNASCSAVSGTLAAPISPLLPSNLPSVGGSSCLVSVLTASWVAVSALSTLGSTPVPSVPVSIPSSATSLKSSLRCTGVRLSLGSIAFSASRAIAVS